MGLPTSDQYVALSTVVTDKFPWLSAAAVYLPDDEWNAEFKAAFLALSNIGRASIDGTISLDHWSAKIAEINLALTGGVPVISDAPLIAAALAAGDVSHNVGIDNNFAGCVCLGLADDGGDAPDMTAWQTVLSSGTLLTPTSTAQPGIPICVAENYVRLPAFFPGYFG